MLNFIIDRCCERDQKAICLDVYEKNFPVIQLYESCGFQYIDTVDLGYGQYGLHQFKLYEKLLELGK